ncbi:MAG: hypothetical protein WBX27_00325 [Specibacter sp.]
MGIKYFALPVPPQLVNIARINPRAFLSDQHFWQSWSDTPDRPSMLTLDKSWWELQQLLGGREPGAPRPAYELVRGDVTHYGYGWIPYDRVLAAEEVLAVANDLAAGLYQACAASFSPDLAAIMYERRSYVESNLGAARTFTAQLAGQGLGLIYSIG